MTEMTTGNFEQTPRASAPAPALDYGARRWLLVGARILSMVFRPSYYPTVAFFVLLTFTYLRMLPFLYRLYVLAIVYLLTYAIPWAGVRVYRHFRNIPKQSLRERKHRLVPYAIHIVCYLVCLDFVWRLHLPTYLLAVVMVAICLQVVCTLVTLFWKISVHSAAVGTVIGGIVIYASLFNFNPVWWLCAAILVSGLVNSSRMLLRQHTLWQVTGGTWVGIGCGLLGILTMQL